MADNFSVRGNIRMPAFFSDNMVLQRDMPLRIWGEANPGEHITVSIHRQNKIAKADIEGRWHVLLDPMDAGGPHELMVEGSIRIRYSNVMAGDVWIASGQSNMYWPVRLAKNPKNEIRNANYPKIRLFTVPERMSMTPEHDLEYGEWLECSPESIADFSAVAYSFGRKIHTELGIPIGLVHASWSGTVAETWISRESLATHPDFANMTGTNSLTESESTGIQEVRKKPDYSQGMDTSAYANVPEDPNEIPSLLFNGMIRAMTPFVIKGVIWYQGESNASRHEQYKTLFPLLINDWRRQWQNPEMPFYFVQLANYMQADQSPADSDWARLREAQAMALSLPNTGMAVAIDLGEAYDIHPANKQDVGIRLACVALNKTYGKDIVCSGPAFKSMTIDGAAIRLEFDHFGSGMIAKGNNDEVKGFAVAGMDRIFHWARAVIDGDQVIVSSPSVNKPVAVRYAWANNPDGANLYNKESLPAIPFRTDDW